MDSKKILLLILIVVAILTAMFIGVGFRRDSTDTTYQQKQDGSFSGLDRVVARRFRSPFDTARVSGCNWNGQGFALGSECAILILPGKQRSSAFELIPTAGVVTACFGFEPDQLTKCIDDSDKRGKLEKGKRRFVVSKDSAFLRLYCMPGSGSQCVVRLTREE
jgi:hypothetical protein